MDWPIIIGVILVVGIGGVVVAKWWFKLSSRYYRYEDEPNIHDKDQHTNAANNKQDNEVVIHWDKTSSKNSTNNITPYQPTDQPTVPRYRLQIAYDGTDFSGWQRQTIPSTHRQAILTTNTTTAAPTTDEPSIQPPSAANQRHACSIHTGPHILEPLTPDADPELRTVQAVLERTIRRVVRQPVAVMGASRTDAGVHAIAQCAVFDTTDNATNRAEGWPADRGPEPLRKAINARLPADIAVLAADIVPDNFNPIADALAKGYAYTLCIAPERTVFQRRYAHSIREQLDIDAMRQAATTLVGTHDFASFAAAGHGRASTIRTIFNCNIIEQHQQHQQQQLDQPTPAPEAQLLRIDVSGDGFLWNMVRIIAGTLVDVGRHRITQQRLQQALTTPDRRLAGPTLPPQGLRLEWIRYPDRVIGSEPRKNPT